MSARCPGIRHTRIFRFIHRNVFSTKRKRGRKREFRSADRSDDDYSELLLVRESLGNSSLLRLWVRTTVFNVSNGFETKLDRSEHRRNFEKRERGLIRHSISVCTAVSNFPRKLTLHCNNIQIFPCSLHWVFYVDICVHIKYELQKLRVGDKKLKIFKSKFKPQDWKFRYLYMYFLCRFVKFELKIIFIYRIREPNKFSELSLNFWKQFRKINDISKPLVHFPTSVLWKSVVAATILPEVVPGYIYLNFGFL